jgi:tRNA U34 5-carboxymethylaminomethyl modifying GTPase MnmE/TrmE
LIDKSEYRFRFDGMPLHIIDTAGLRDSDNVVEQEGVRRAHAEIQKADKILLLIDVSNCECEVNVVSFKTLFLEDVLSTRDILSFFLGLPSVF